MTYLSASEVMFHEEVLYQVYILLPLWIPVGAETRLAGSKFVALTIEPRMFLLCLNVLFFLR